MHELKGAMIGAGYFAQYQAEAWNRISGIRITAIVDSVFDKAKTFAQRWGIPQVYSDAATMLQRERPDFVDIVTRPDSHWNLVSLAAHNGVHVICQKPMAPDWKEAVSMVETCSQSGIRLLMHENWRWQPWYREIKRLMVEGSVGKPYHLAFRMRAGDGLGPEPYKTQPYFREMPRLLIYEMLVHQLDTTRFLCGEIESIFCQYQRINPVIRGEDSAQIQFLMANGIQGFIDANRINGREPAKVAMGSFRVEGDRGMVRLTSSGKLFISENGQEELPHSFPHPELGYKGDSVKAAQEHYRDCLMSGTPCETEGQEYLKTVAAVEACYRSASTGQTINPHPLNEASLPG
ncbi:MAG: Gfo/Idh/MocA family oxidoreductase [Terriglobia bacterium]